MGKTLSIIKDQKKLGKESWSQLPGNRKHPIADEARARNTLAGLLNKYAECAKEGQASSEAALSEHRKERRD